MRFAIWTAVAVVCALIVMAGLVMAGRFQIETGAQYQAWRVDRLTGAVSYCGLVDHKLVCIPVPEATITPKKMAPEQPSH